MEESSRFDRALLALARGPRGLDFVAAVERAQSEVEGMSAHAAVETVFAGDTHPFEDLRLKDSRVSFAEGAGFRLVEVSDADGQWAAVAFETDYPGVYHLASGQPRTSGRWDKLERAVFGRGGASRVYLNHRDFLAIARRLETFDEVVVSRATARVAADGSSIGRGFPEGTLSPRPTPEGAILEMEERGGVLRTMTMHSSSLHLQLRRVAGATFYAGQARVFRDDVLRPMADAAAARRNLVRDRERRSVGEDVNALTLALSSELFKDLDDTGVLLDVAASMPNTSVAVFHRNPYLHFAIRDERDGSNFDVVVTEANAIQIFPGYKATQEALARVSQDLGERFGAVAIEDSPVRERVSMLSLIG